MDDLSVLLNSCNTGCFVGNTLINHLMYADDLVIISPSSAGFQELLNVCTDYGANFDVKYNVKKSVAMVCRTREDKDLSLPSFYLAGQELPVRCKCKYLGHVITEQMNDDDDLFRQRRTLYAQANMMRRKFHCCSVEVKVNLFRTYCTPLYTAPLWVRFKKGSLYKLQVTYNDCLRILLKQPRWCSASDLFCRSGVSTFHALLRTLMYTFICRLNVSKNSVVMVLVDPLSSDTRYQSALWKHWYNSLL